MSLTHAQGVIKIFSIVETKQLSIHKVSTPDTPLYSRMAGCPVTEEND
jgi:hypothetical protein